VGWTSRDSHPAASSGPGRFRVQPELGPFTAGGVLLALDQRHSRCLGRNRPARRVHPGAVSVARRHGLDLTHATPKLARDVLTGDELLIAVCDRAYEDVDGPLLHWSIPDPAVKEDPHAFDAAYDDITQRIDRLASSLEGEPR